MRLVLLAKSPSARDQEIITELFKANGASFWHWFPTAWLIQDLTDRDPAFWTHLIRDVAPNLVFLLIDVDDPDRAPIGYMKPEWYAWIQTHWQR